MHKNELLVSVICPAHNRVRWLKEAVQSVLAQTHQNLELIIIDDASAPPLENQLMLNDNRIKIIRQDKNIGPGAAREVGRNIAAGDYIGYLDSDDYLHPEKIEKQVAALKENPWAGMCYCTSATFDELPLKPKLPIWSLSDQNFESILPVILHQRPWSTSACLWTRKATDLIGPWSSLWVGEDIEYETRAGCKGIKIFHLPEILAFYRQSDQEYQLSNYSINRQIQGTDYKLLLAYNLANSDYSKDKEIQAKIINILLNQSIFLLSQGDKELANTCIKSILPFSENNKEARSYLTILNAIYSFFPKFISVPLARYMRHQYHKTQENIIHLEILSL